MARPGNVAGFQLRALVIALPLSSTPRLGTPAHFSGPDVFPVALPIHSVVSSREWVEAAGAGNSRVVVVPGRRPLQGARCPGAPPTQYPQNRPVFIFHHPDCVLSPDPTVRTRSVSWTINNRSKTQRVVP